MLENYKNISYCDVTLRPLTFLVGPNGSGKSNFLDSLAFVREALSHNLPTSLADRGELSNLLTNTAGPDATLGMRLEFSLPGGQHGHYAFRIAQTAGGGYHVLREECYVHSQRSGESSHYVVVENGHTASNPPLPPWHTPPNHTELSLNAHRALTDSPIYDAIRSLAGMYSYNIVPSSFRSPQSTSRQPSYLTADGSNLPSVIARLANDHPEKVQRIEEYLAQINPAAALVRTRVLGGMRIVEFSSRDRPAQSLDASRMSDGTLRVLGILTALYQTSVSTRDPLTLVGIEEPETAIHPAAALVLLDALHDASEEVQVIVTSHSPELLDNKDISPASIISFSLREGVTRVGGLDEVGISVIRDRLATPGELLRVDQIRPSAADSTVHVSSLFGES